MSLLLNIILSTRPCPVCKDAARQPPMTLQQWQQSRWGDTDSKRRYCNLKGHYCHCILVPPEMLPDIPEIGKKVTLRGDPDTDIRSIVEIHPNEELLKELMDEYNLTLGKLPKKIYDMPLEEVAGYLDDLLKGKKPPGGLSGSIKKFKKIIMDAFHRDGYEHSKILNKDGRIVMSKSGDRHSVRYHPHEIEKMRNAEVFIHNHPSGSSFSEGDLNFFADLKVKKAIVVSDDFIYELSPRVAWPDPDTISAEWMTQQFSTWEIYVEKYIERVKSGMSKSEAFKITKQEETHSIMNAVSKIFDLIYTRKLARGG